MGEITIGRMRRGAMLAAMQPEAIPVRMLASSTSVAAAPLVELHGSKSSTESIVCSVMNRFSVSDDRRVSRPTLTYAIRRALSQFLSVPGRTPRYVAASSTESNGPRVFSARARLGVGWPLPTVGGLSTNGVADFIRGFIRCKRCAARWINGSTPRTCTATCTKNGALPDTDCDQHCVTELITHDARERSRGRDHRSDDRARRHGANRISLKTSSAPRIRIRCSPAYHDHACRRAWSRTRRRPRGGRASGHETVHRAVPGFGTTSVTVSNRCCSKRNIA
jgi:hypothetical protein